MTDKLAQLMQAVVSSSDNPYIKSIAELVYRTCKGERQISQKGEELLRFVSQPHESHIPHIDVEERTNFIDRRITDLGVRNFRAFSQTKDNKMCGIKLHKNGHPLSVFMVGSNGSGKSSLFSALETLYSCQITTKSLMNIIDEDNYEIHDFGKKEQVGKAAVEIFARFVDKSELTRKFSNEVPNPIGPPSIFCSDYDVEQVSRHRLDLTPFILSQNGYSSVYEFHSHILAEWFADLQELQNSRRAELQRLNDIDISKEDLLTIYSTLLSLTQEENRKIDFNYYIGVCDDILDVIHSFREKALSIDKTDKNHAVPEMLDAINYIVNRFSHIKKGQYNKYIYSTISTQWNDLIKSLETEENRLTDDPLSLINEFLTNEGSESLKFSVIAKASTLKKILNMSQDSYMIFKDNISRWPQVQEDFLKKLSVLQSDEDAEIKVKDFISQVSQLQEAVRLFQKKLKDEISKIVDTFIETQGENIDKALSWFSEEGETFHFHKDEATGYPVVTILYQRGSEVIDTYPSLYLNTFRFRLFVITLKIALAFSFMQQEKVITPIVIDEVFNSSDFENRLRLEHFVQLIYTLYDDMHISSSRLQLILFTHDEVVLRSFVRGSAMRRKYDFNEYFLRDYLQARLFRQSDAEKMNVCHEKDGTIEYLNLYRPIS